MRAEAYGDFFQWDQDELDAWYYALDGLDGEYNGIQLQDIERQIEIAALIGEEAMSMNEDGAIDFDEDEWYYSYWGDYYYDWDSDWDYYYYDYEMYDAATMVKAITSVTLLGASIYYAF